MAFPGGAQIAVIRHGLNVPLPAMQLDFLNNTSLNSRVTFSRGTNATLVDSTGKITYAPANLITNSQNFSAWTLIAASLTTGVTDPLGGTTAATVTATGAYGGISILTASPGSVTTLVSSFWARRRTGTGNIAIYVPSGTANSLITLTNEWQRFWITGAPGAVNSYVRVEIAVVGDAIDIAFGQLEPVTYQTTPGPYVATTASAYYGPRFDYDPVTLAPRGLLIEEARTNLFTYSDDFTNAAWLKVAATVTANVTTSPDGTVNADKLAEDATTDVHSIYQTYSQTSGVTYTFSFYAKAAERTWVRTRGGVGVNYFNLANGTLGNLAAGATASIIPAGNGWYRCAVTLTALTTGLANNQIAPTTGNGVDNFAGTAGSGVFIYGAQQEVGAFATSYIPTVASTVSRSADVATMTGTNFSSWYNQTAGTFVADYDVLTVLGGVKALVIASDGTTSERIYSYVNSAIPTLLVTDNGVTQATLPNTDIPANTTAKLAFAYALNDIAVSSNAGTVGVDTSATIPAANQLGVGSFVPSGSYLNGHIRAIAYYNTRLPNTQLQTLTAPSLASPLALDFISPTYTVGY